MSVKAVYEYSAKKIIKHSLNWDLDDRSVLITGQEDLDECLKCNPWLQSQSLVCKPDILVKRRGKLGLIVVNADFDDVKTWISQRLGKVITVSLVFIPLVFIT